MSKLHDSLKKVDLELPSGKKINLYKHISRVKNSAEEWLSGLEKNGFEHSERLENYLDDLTNNLRKSKKITSGEIFILLCAVYMHDIGYNLMGKNVSTGHASRSQEMILKNPKKYHFGDFPPFKGDYPRVAEAVGLVCLGHKTETDNDNLNQIPDEFPDFIFPTEEINLRKITALLRLADEADDPYIRFNISTQSIRNRIPLVQIKGNTIIWHWDRTLEKDSTIFSEYIDEKIATLETSINYIHSVGGETWYIVLHPQIRKKQIKQNDQQKPPILKEDQDNIRNLYRLNYVLHKKTSPSTPQINSSQSDSLKIQVYGCGGAGNQIIFQIFQKNFSRLETIAIHTNKQYLDSIRADKRVLIGRTLTKGLGANSDPSIGKKAAEVAKPTLKAIIDSTDIVFITAGMGGGTGTGSAPEIARLAKQQGAIVIAIVTYPFQIERSGIKRADKGIRELLAIANTTIVVDNNDFLNINPNLTIYQIISMIDRMIADTVCDICESILDPSSIKIGVTDIRSILSNGGLAAISIGEANDRNKVRIALSRCFDNLFNIKYSEAMNAFIHISSGNDLTVTEIETIERAFKEKLNSKTEIVYGARVGKDTNDKTRIIVLFSGLELPQKFINSKK